MNDPGLNFKVEVNARLYVHAEGMSPFPARTEHLLSVLDALPLEEKRRVGWVPDDSLEKLMLREKEVEALKRAHEEESRLLGRIEMLMSNVFGLWEPGGDESVRDAIERVIYEKNREIESLKKSNQ